MEITNLKEVSVEEKEMMYTVMGYGALNRAFSEIGELVEHRERIPKYKNLLSQLGEVKSSETKNQIKEVYR